MLFFLSSVKVPDVTEEKLSDRVARLIAEAQVKGLVGSQTDALKRAGITSGWFGELRQREDRFAAGSSKARPSMRGDKAAALAEVLGVTVDELLGGPPGATASEVERQKAIEAARALNYPEWAISEVARRPARPGLERLDWFHEIEVVSKDLLPSSPGSSELTELPRDLQRQR